MHSCSYIYVYICIYIHKQYGQACGTEYQGFMPFLLPSEVGEEEDVDNLGTPKHRKCPLPGVEICMC